VIEPVGADLEVRNLHLWRGDRHVLRGVGFTAPAGSLWHVRGPNGAGKTSLLRVIAGFLWPEDGEVRWRGAPALDQRDTFAAELAYLGHEPALKADLTARENVSYQTGLRHPVDAARMDAVFARLGIAAHVDRPARMLSAGQRRRAAMARILLAEAPLWLLDEPFTNLDTAGVELLTALMAEHAAAGGVVLATTHQPLQAAGVRTLELA
jgi:heme exporter protein A